MSYRFQHGESVENGVHRIVREQIDKGIDELESQEPHGAIHQVRKRCKKIRAVAKLIRPGLGKRYSGINAFYRDTARPVSDLRDAESRRDCLAKLREQFGDHLQATVFEELDDRLLQWRRHVAEIGKSLEDQLAELKRQLQRGRQELSEWHINGDADEAMLKGLKKSYSRGMAALQEAMDDRTDEALHEWRKRVKNHWYHLRLIRNAWKPVLKKRTAEAGHLADDLGDDRDLALLALRCEDIRPRVNNGTGIDLLICAARRRREQLQDEALSLGRRLYVDTAGAFVERFRGHWKTWRTG